MAAALLKRWPLVAGVAAALALGAMALLSEDRQRTLTEHVADGPMRAVPEADVVAVQVRRGTQQREIRREGAAWVSTPDLPASTLQARLTQGLRLLRNTVEERRFDTAPPEFGLGDDALVVTVRLREGPPFELRFGQLNPLGLGHYVRWQQGSQAPVLTLMPAYVGEAWEQVLAP